MTATPAVAIVSEPTDAPRTRKTRWYGRFRELSVKLAALGLAASVRAEVLREVDNLIDGVHGYHYERTAICAQRARELVAFEGIANEQAGLPPGQPRGA